jgi:hypothetical protein
LNIADDPNLLLQPAASTCLLVLLIAAQPARRSRPRSVRSGEFHVKTPEKA